MTVDPSDIFPRTGVRARRIARFERDLHAWLQTPEGRFATWRAACSVEGTPVAAAAPPSDGDDRA